MGDLIVDENSVLKNEKKRKSRSSFSEYLHPCALLPLKRLDIVGPCLRELMEAGPAHGSLQYCVFTSKS